MTNEEFRTEGGLLVDEKTEQEKTTLKVQSKKFSKRNNKKTYYSER